MSSLFLQKLKNNNFNEKIEITWNGSITLVHADLCSDEWSRKKKKILPHSFEHSDDWRMMFLKVNELF